MAGDNCHRCDSQGTVLLKSHKKAIKNAKRQVYRKICLTLRARAEGLDREIWALIARRSKDKALALALWEANGALLLALAEELQDDMERVGEE